MQLQSSVHYDMFSELFYLHQDGKELRSSLRRYNINAQSDNGKIKQLPELIESMRFYCSDFTSSANCRDGFYIDKLTYLVKLYRRVKIFDADDKVDFQNHNFNGGNFEFILAKNDDLIRLSDVAKALKVPFYFDGVKTDKELKSNTPVYIEKYDKHNAIVRPLTMQDRVVDRNLNQIWPMPTGQIPGELQKLLEQTTEKVR